MSSSHKFVSGLSLQVANFDCLKRTNYELRETDQSKLFTEMKWFIHLCGLDLKRLE